MTLFQLRGLPVTTLPDGTKVQVTAFGAETVPEAAPEADSTVPGTDEALE